MFKKEKENVDVKELLKRNIELEVENKRLIYEQDSIIKMKDMDISELQKKLCIKESELRDCGKVQKSDLENTIRQLNEKVKRFQFEKDNNTETIELETENIKLKSELDIAKSENAHLKKLLDTYREIPDVKKMIDNLSGLTVPNIEELKEFSKIVNGNEMKGIIDEMRKTNLRLIDTNDEIARRLIR